MFWQRIFCGSWKAEEEAIKRALGGGTFKSFHGSSSECGKHPREENLEVCQSSETLQVDPLWGNVQLLCIQHVPKARGVTALALC